MYTERVSSSRLMSRLKTPAKKNVRKQAETARGSGLSDTVTSAFKWLEGKQEWKGGTGARRASPGYQHLSSVRANTNRLDISGNSAAHLRVEQWAEIQIHIHAYGDRQI